MSRDSDRVTFGGKTVDRRTADMLKEAERLADAQDPSIGRFHLTQGSWSHVAASAGTHGGPGAFDMYTSGYTEEQKQIIGLALRRVGFASWRRRPSEGNWEEHWHGIAMGTEDLPSIAEQQVASYRSGHNGLKGNGPDRDTRPKQIVTWEEYQRSHADGADDHLDAQSGASQDDHDQPKDADKDGLTDSFERLAGTEVHDPDSDDDGFSDGHEAVITHTNPKSEDTDDDGVDDVTEVRRGTDPGRLRGSTGVVGTGVFAENARTARDTDGDGLTNKFEKLVGTDKHEVDTDRDGVADAMEVSFGTDPTNVDSDFDGQTDSRELRHGGDPLSATVDAKGHAVEIKPWTAEEAHARRQADAEAAEQGETPTQRDAVGEAGRLPGVSESEPDSDQDEDGLTAAFEDLVGTSDDDEDSDDDGLSDAEEALDTHTDPLADDTDGDDVLDGVEIKAGTKAGRLAGDGGVTGRGIFAENIRSGYDDADGDGLSKHTEELLHTDAESGDTDHDDVLDAMEISLGTDPTDADTDDDGMTDGYEVHHHTDPLVRWSEEEPDPLADDGAASHGAHAPDTVDLH